MNQYMNKVSILVDRLRGSALFKDSFWAVTGSVIGRGLALIAGIFIARFLGSEAYGEYGTIKNSLILIAMISSMGLGYSSTKFIAECKDTKEQYKIPAIHKISTYITVIASSIIAILIYIYAKEIALWLEAERLYIAIRLSTLAVVFNALNTTQIGELSGLGAYKELARNNAISGIITFILSILLTYYYQLNGAIYALSISLIFNSLINHISIKKHINNYNSKALTNKSSFVRSIIKFSIPIALQESLFAITSWGSTIILVKFSSYSELGISSAASIWMNIMLFIPGALRNVSLSHLSSSNDDNTKNKVILKRLFIINLISTLIPCLIVGILTKYIVAIYGDTYQGLEIVLPVSLMCAIVCSMANVLSQEFIAKGENWILFLFGAIRCSIGIVVLYVLTQYSSQGALMSSLTLLGTHIIYLVALGLHIRYKHNNK